MRQRFEQQIPLGTVAIPDVTFQLKSRDELPPTLAALQHIFIIPELNEKVFALLEKKICANKKKTGRPGMDLWHILVLAVVRHATNTNWDTLTIWANELKSVRQMLGVHNPVLDETNPIIFNYQTILDNASLVDEKLLYEINQLVVEAGHKLLKKKEDEELELKSDSFVVETNVHFPTDLNLLWDSVRKGLDMVERLNKLGKIIGWRKIKSLRRDFKSVFRHTSQIVFRGKDEKKKKEAVKAYLQVALGLKERCEAIIKNPPLVPGSQEEVMAIIELLESYCKYAATFCDQIERRLIKGEAIPAEEKVFSIFEPHTEWITKGKQNKKVELGLLMMITTDQHQLIVDYKVMEKERDPAQVEALLKRMDKNFPTAKIASHSFDKGYHSKENQKILDESKVKRGILPKKGKHNKEDKERESDPEFKKLRRKHSGVESNINMLEHHGLNRCMDKGLPGFKRYVGLSVLAYNLHIIGNYLIEEEKKKQERLQRQRERYHFRQAA
jgi:IS5 family transposase